MNKTVANIAKEATENLENTAGKSDKSLTVHTAPIVYLVIALLIMLGPLVGMLWYHEDPNLQTSELATWPATTSEQGAPNIEFLSQAGNYFEDHFAYRPEALTLHAQLQTTTLGVSTTSQVIHGKDGWLYYGGTLNDFTGNKQPSARALFNEVHNLRLLQDYVEASGAQFAVTIAPNKNALIAQNMPYWYLPASQPAQQTLIDGLQDEGINYIDLFTLYNLDSNALTTSSMYPSTLPQYFKRDSHWTNAGAYRAYRHIMNALSSSASSASSPAPPPLLLTDAQAIPRQDHTGDIDALLYPAATTLETSYYYPLPAYAYSSPEKTVEASSSATVNPTGSGTLLMYRDSFANALIPFFSATYNKAYYSKLLPYDLTDLARYQPDVVLVEMAQRSTLNFSANPPALPGPVTTQVAEKNALATAVTSTTLTTRVDGSYVVASGILDEQYVNDQTLVYVRVTQADGTNVTREAFLTTARVPQATQTTAGAAASATAGAGAGTSTGTTAAEVAPTTDFGYRIFLPYSHADLQGSGLDVIIKVQERYTVIAHIDYQ